MTISMYQARVPRFINMLNKLSSGPLDETALPGFRLDPDMLPTARQVMSAGTPPGPWPRAWPAWRSRSMKTRGRRGPN